MHGEQQEKLNGIINDFSQYSGIIGKWFEKTEEEELKRVNRSKTEILNAIERLMIEQADGIQNERYSSRNSQLMFTILFELKDMTAVAARFIKLMQRLEIEENKFVPFITSRSE